MEKLILAEKKAEVKAKNTCLYCNRKISQKEIVCKDCSPEWEDYLNMLRTSKP